MTYGKHMNDLTEICQQVWTAVNLEDKKNLLKRAVATFKYRQKVVEFIRLIDSAKFSMADADKMASNLILNKTDKVASMLPR